MEHIRQFDWCYSEPEYYFVKEEDLNNCVTERILRNQFRDPMVSSDSEEEKPTFDWDKIFTKDETGEKLHRMFVPGARGPQFPKLSALTSHQHYQCLKVLCAQNPHILENEFICRPTKQDYRVFEEVQAIYAKEQKEYVEWAKTLWTNDHCIRALRPKPPVETAYEAEFEVRAKKLESFPKKYEMVAQIPLEEQNTKFEMVHDKDLINVDISVLPQIEYPNLRKRFSLMTPRAVPEPCTKHPCRFLLPNESSVTILPLTEVHRELAQYALDNGAQFIASEKVLKCLMEVDRHWTVCLSVCEAFTVDGEKRNVLVLGSEISVMRECAQTRTYRALRHLLEYALIPDSEKSKLLYRNKGRQDRASGTSGTSEAGGVAEGVAAESSDDEGGLLIVADDLQTNGESGLQQMECDATETANGKPSKNSQTKKSDTDNGSAGCGHKKKYKSKEKNKNDFYKCTCEDTMFERPPPRSFKKWRVRNLTTQENCDMIVHCPHKVKNKDGEVILEPIPEYQIELGASEVSKEKIKSLALSLYLRKNATLMNVRIDAPSGDVVRCDSVGLDELTLDGCQGEVLAAVSNAVGTALNQLQGLLPGHYLLQHEPSHGTNALLYSPRLGTGDDLITLNFDCSQLAEADEAKCLKTPPTLTPILLPAHKFRKILPCAFTTNEAHLAKEPRRPATRQRTPPQALTWPKKNFRGKRGRRRI